MQSTMRTQAPDLLFDETTKEYESFLIDQWSLVEYNNKTRMPQLNELVGHADRIASKYKGTSQKCVWAGSLRLPKCDSSTIAKQKSLIDLIDRYCVTHGAIPRFMLNYIANNCWVFDIVLYSE